MRRYRDFPIKWKLTLIITLTSGAAMALGCAAFIGYESVQLRRETAFDLITLGNMTAAHSTAPLSFADPKAAEEVLRALDAQSHILKACIYLSPSRGEALRRSQLCRGSSAFPGLQVIKKERRRHQIWSDLACVRSAASASSTRPLSGAARPMR